MWIYNNGSGYLIWVAFQTKGIVIHFLGKIMSQLNGAAIQNVCSADHWWFARLAQVVRQSL